MKEILINQKENTKQILLVEDGNLVEKYEENEKISRIEGNIYIGKVENILQGMQSAFVDIGQNKNIFIHLKFAIVCYTIAKSRRCRYVIQTNTNRSG